MTDGEVKLGYFNEDCMDVMRRLPDKTIGLAVVDPPYGIGLSKWHRRAGGKVFVVNPSRNTKAKYREYRSFDDARPGKEYFDELFRVSRAQVIWGGNFMLDFLGPCSCMLVWDKGRRGLSQADCEIAWTSLKGQSRVFNFKWNGFMQEDMRNKERRIHPTQKPVALYRWILSSFAKEGDVVLDTHVGSASSLIACEELGFSYIGCEIDGKFYRESVERMEEYRRRRQSG